MTKMRQSPTLTPEDIVATIKRSRFPSIVAEGSDDVIVYRRLEEDFSESGASIIPAGGRNTIIEVFKRRTEFSGKFVVFLADQDTWIFSGVPTDYHSGHFILTNGYSVENDMFQDGDLLSLLDPNQRAKFFAELSVVCQWYAIAVNRLANGQDERLKVHPNELLDDPVQKARLLQLDATEVDPIALRQQIVSNYERLLRGKCLIQLLLRNLTNHSTHALLNFAASRRGPHFTSISQRVGRQLSIAVT